MGKSITVDGVGIAVATQYPSLPQVESHLLLALAEKRATVLVVLATDDEIDYQRLPRYFGDRTAKHEQPPTERKYGGVTVQYCGYVREKLLADGLIYDLYSIVIEAPKKKGGKDEGASVPMGVLHVTNWPARRRTTSGSSAKFGGVSAVSLATLAGKVQEMHQQRLSNYEAVGNRSLGVPGRMLPVFHDAGVGAVGGRRSATLIAAYALGHDHSCSLESVASEEGKARMVPTCEPLRVLARLASENGNPILQPERQGPFGAS